MSDPIAETISRHLRDLEPVGVHPARGFLLGAVDGDPGVQPRDLGAVVEVFAPRASHAAIDRRVRGLFNVLGTRRVPAGTAYACTVPPTLRRSVRFGTFTILLGARAEAAAAALR